MYKYYFLFFVLSLLSCKQNSTTENATNPYEIPVDDYQLSEEELERQRIEDSINEATNSAILEATALFNTNGVYTDREDIITILLQLDFISGFKGGTATLEQIIPDPESEKDHYLKLCKHKSNTVIEFMNEPMFDDPALYPIASTSNLDTDYYYIEKVTVNKDGDEIELSLKSISTDGSLEEYNINPFMVYRYDYYVLEFYDKSFAHESVVYHLEVEECEEEDRG